MENYLFMRPLLRLLAKNDFFTKLVAVMLRVLAALIVLGSLASFFKAGKVIFDLPTSGIMGGIMFQIFYILAIYSVTHAIIIRARDIETLPQIDFFVLPVGTVLLRLLGEIYAAYVALTAVGGGIFVWFTGERIGKVLSPMPLFFPAPQKPDFMGGIELMLSGIMIATGVLIAAYVLAELLVALGRSVAIPPKALNGPRQILDHRTKSRLGM